MTARYEALYTGTDGRLLRPLPLGLGAIDTATEWQRVLAVAEYSADDREEAISFYSMSIRSQGVTTAPSDCSVLRRFALQAGVSTMEVADMGHEGLMLLAGSTRGHLFRLRLRYRNFPTLSADDIEWTLLDGEEEGDDRLSPWRTQHRGEITGVALSPDSKKAVSVGRDGGIYLLDPIHGQIGHAVKQPRPTASYYAVKWVSNTMLVTTGTTGGLEVWDSREKQGKPAGRSPLPWGHTGHTIQDQQQGVRRRLTCLGTHSSRPHFCASGSSSATVAVWDLRFQSKPLIESAAHASAGDVTEVHFDSHAMETSSSPDPAILFSTEDGCLFSTQPRSKPTGDLSPLVSNGVQKQHLHPLVEGAAVNVPSFSVDPGNGRDIFGVGGLESLLFLSRAGCPA